jgi:hypothetical protein
MVLVKLDSYMQNEIRLLLLTMSENQLKMDERFKCKTQNHEITRRKQEKHFLMFK